MTTIIINKVRKGAESTRKMCSAVDWSDVSCVLPVYSSNLVRLEDHSCVDWSHANDIHEYSIIM